MPDLDESTEGTQVVLSSPPAVQAPADDEFDKDRAMATITKLRAFEKDAKAKIARLAQLETAEQERATAELSEVEKLRKQLADTQARADAAQALANAERIKTGAQAAAVALQTPFTSSEALSDAVALGAFAELEIGEDGKIPGLNEAIKQLHKTRPYLFGAAATYAPDINAGARGAGSSSKQDVIEANRQRLAQRAGRY